MLERIVELPISFLFHISLPDPSGHVATPSSNAVNQLADWTRSVMCMSESKLRVHK
jgi:hypothetical protein